MSKKMLKRSLTLGALMAFVITGQAWAAEVDNNIILSGDSVSFDEKTIQMQDSAVQGIKGYGELKVTDTLTVNSIGNAISAADGDLTISANKVYLTTNNTVDPNNPTNGIVITENQENLTGKKVLIKDFSVLSIKAHGHGINTCQGDGNTISLIGKKDSTVSITAGENGVYTYKYNSDYEPKRNRIEIRADAVTIDATAYIGNDATYKGYAVIAANKNSTIEIEATGKVDLDGANGAIKAMNGSTVEVTGSTIDIDVNEAFNNRVVGIYAIGNTVDKNDKVIHSTVNVAGPSDIYVINNSYSQGVRVEDGGVVILDAVKIYAESVQSEVDGLKAISSYVPNSVGSSIAVSGIAEVEAKGKTWAQGLYSAYSTVAFEKTATITSSTSADGAYSYAVRVLSDTGSNVSSVTFNDSAKLSASGDNAIGIQASGSNPLGVKFENGNVEVTANGSTSARGMSVAYTSGVEAATCTSVVINATSTKGAAYGVLNTYNVDNEKAGANVNLLGNVEIIAKGVDEENSLAIYNKANSAGESGVTTVGGEGKKVVLKGDVVAEGGSVTTTFGAVGSQFDGKVTTANVANTTLKFNAGTWNLNKEASTISNVTFGADSKLVIDGATFKYNDAANATNVYALTAAGTEKSLTVTNGAKLVITGGEEAKTYNIAKGFAEGAGENWTLEADNALWIADWTDVDNNVNTLQATIALKDADQLVSTGVVEDTHADFVASVMESKDDNADDVKEFLKETVGAGATPVAKAQAKEKIAQAFQAGEAAGTSATAANIVKNTTGATTQRMSFSNRPSAHKGGHGPSVSEDKNGGAIWAQYVHGKDKVTDMPMAGTTASYEGKFNGVVLGADFKQVGKYQSGVSFNYGEGDTYSTGSSAYSRNDYDFWGIGYYGAVQNADSNVIFDVNYAKSDTDVEQMNGTTTITASPETTTWSAGVRVEKLIDKGAVQYVPYTGLRYMSIDTDSYTNSLNVVTETERQDIWLLPVGVSFRQDNVYDSGWVVTPKVDLSYIWAFGDTESEMTIDVPGATDVSFSRLGYTVMDDGSFLGSIGLEASKGDWTFGVAYSYQKGDYSRSDKWYVDAKYSF